MKGICWCIEIWGVIIQLTIIKQIEAFLQGWATSGFIRNSRFFFFTFMEKKTWARQVDYFFIGEKWQYDPTLMQTCHSSQFFSKNLEIYPDFPIPRAKIPGFCFVSKLEKQKGVSLCRMSHVSKLTKRGLKINFMIGWIDGLSWILCTLLLSEWGRLAGMGILRIFPHLRISAVSIFPHSNQRERNAKKNACKITLTEPQREMQKNCSQKYPLQIFETKQKPGIFARGIGKSGYISRFLLKNWDEWQVCISVGSYLPGSIMFFFFFCESSIKCDSEIIILKWSLPSREIWKKVKKFVMGRKVEQGKMKYLEISCCRVLTS